MTFSYFLRPIIAKFIYKLTMFSRHGPESKIGVVSVYRHYDLDMLRKDLEDCFCVYTDLLIWKNTEE